MFEKYQEKGMSAVEVAARLHPCLFSPRAHKGIYRVVGVTEEFELNTKSDHTPQQQRNSSSHRNP